MHMGGKGKDNKIKALFEIQNKNCYPGLAIQTEAESEEELLTKAKSFFWGAGDKVTFIYSETIPEDLKKKLMEIPYEEERRVEDKPVEEERRISTADKLADLIREAEELERRIDKQGN